MLSILCVQVFQMHICLYIMCRPGAYGGQKVLETGVSQPVSTADRGSSGAAVLSTTKHLSSLRTISVLCLFVLGQFHYLAQGAQTHEISALSLLSARFGA